MTVKELKSVLKQIEQETQQDWDDAKIYFSSDVFDGYNSVTGKYKVKPVIKESHYDRTQFQNAPIRAIIFKD